MAGSRARGVCRYYLEGTCRYGDNCRFEHSRQNTVRPGGGSGGVCKFYLDGKCRFGDSCKFIHPGKGGGGGGGGGGGRQGSYGNQRGRYQPPPVDTGRGWNQKDGGNPFDLYSSGYDNTDNGWRGGHRDSGRSGHDRDHQHSWKEQWDGSGGSRGGGRSRGRGGSQGGDRYHYSSPNYKQSQPSWDRGGAGRGWGDQRPRNDDTRRDPLKWERRELFKRDEQTPPPSVTTDPRDLAALISNDMGESRSMWPFSCYGYSKEVSCVPGLTEISAEEVRLLAYTAKAAGTSAAFLQNMKELERRQSDTRHQYINITPEEVKNMLTLLMGQSSVVSSGSGDWSAGLFGPVSTTTSIQNATSSIFGSNFAASNSLFETTTKPQVTFPTLPQQSKPLFASTAVAQLIPPSVDLQPQQPAPAQSTTSQSQHVLSQEDLDAFKANNFILGKIPEHTPPPDLC